MLLLLVLACPTAIPSVAELFTEGSNPVEGSGLSPEEMSGPQLTALAGTIEALSTQLAASGDGTQSPEQIQTAVMKTLVAGGDPFADPSETPGPFVVGDGTPTGTVTPGPSPTPSLSPTPGPSPTPSNTPTVTYTPSPGPSPTPSKTPTATYTASPGPSPTPSKTPTPTWTPTTGSPTSTNLPPSSTPTATSTPNASGTTMVFPTDPPTAVIDPCEGIEFMGFWFGNPIVGADIYNGSTKDIRIDSIYFDWPKENNELFKIDLNGDEIWNQGDTEPPTSIAEEDFKGSDSDREIPAFTSASLVAVFDNTDKPGFYFIKITFDNGCSISS
jgi:hypothetical protein